MKKAEGKQLLLCSTLTVNNATTPSSPQQENTQKKDDQNTAVHVT